MLGPLQFASSVPAHGPAHLTSYNESSWSPRAVCSGPEGDRMTRPYSSHPTICDLDSDSMDSFALLWCHPMDSRALNSQSFKLFFHRPPLMDHRPMACLTTHTHCSEGSFHRLPTFSLFRPRILGRPQILDPCPPRTSIPLI